MQKTTIKQFIDVSPTPLVGTLNEYLFIIKAYGVTKTLIIMDVATWKWSAMWKVRKVLILGVGFIRAITVKKLMIHNVKNVNFKNINDVHFCNNRPLSILIGDLTSLVRTLDGSCI